MKDSFAPLKGASFFFEEVKIARETKWQRFRKNRTAYYSLLFLGMIFIFAVLGPLFSFYEYDGIDLKVINQPPSHRYWFGTDDLGRDLFTRVWWGARISLFVGFGAAIIDLFIGVIYGSLSALCGGKIDELMMRVSDIFYSIPYVLTMILFITVFGTGLFSIMLAITITGWINMARIIRGQILEIRERNFVKAATLLGASRLRTIFYHLIPNTVGMIITTVTYTIPSAIFTEAFLSFLGLGVQAPAASWGVLVSEGIGALQYYPWRLFFPAIVITLTIFAFNAIGDGLRDALEINRGDFS